MSNYDWAVHWIIEREKIRLKKEASEPFPWTKDPILSAYRFCNVRREDDTVTKWIAEHIRKRFSNERLLWRMLCIARVINWPPILDYLIESGMWPNYADLAPATETYPKDLGYFLEDTNKDYQVFTGAYVIPAGSIKGVPKGQHVALNMIGPLWRDREKISRQIETFKSLRGTHLFLKAYNGWSNFLSYQAVVDMRFTPLLSSAGDIDNWAAAGPGTVRGLNRLAGREVTAALSQWKALDEMRHLWPRLVDDGGVEMDFSDVPNVLCETDKYLRVKNGEGTPRVRYVPGRGS